MSQPHNDLIVIPPDTSSPPPTPVRTSGNRGCLWILGGIFACVVLTLLIPAVLVLLGVTSVGALLGGVGGALGAYTAPPSVASVISTQTIVQGIQPLGQLISVSAQLAQADIAVSVGQGALNACGHQARHVAQGTIEAGIDLTQITENSLGYNAATDTYTLILPAPQLTSCRVDYIRQYDRSFTTCDVDWDEARLLASYTSLIDFRDDAVEGGILTRAEQEARLVLSNFIQIVSGRRVEILFNPTDANMIPASCEPNTPTGWVYVPENRHWSRRD